jgi:hypothetical protein
MPAQIDNPAITQEGIPMKWILYLFSILWIVYGSFAILYTARHREILKNILKTTHLKIIAVVPFTAGILLLLSSSASHYPWFIRLIGLFAIVKGGFIFLNPHEIVPKLNHWYLNTLSDQTCRLYGIMAILLGSAVFSWVL